MGRLVGRKLFVPVFFSLGALVFCIPAAVDVVRHFKRRMIPAKVFAGGLDFIVTQRRTVAIMAAAQVGRAVTDDGLGADQGGLVIDRPGFVNGLVDGSRIMTVYIANHVPAIGLETLGCIVGEPAFDVAVDRNTVVVPEGRQLAQPQGSGQRTGFVGDTFHHAAITHKHKGVVVDDVVAVTVELTGHHLFGNRHADGIGDALPQRASGGLHTWRIAILGMTRGFGMQLTEVLQIVDGQVVTGQVQQRVDQHGAMTVGQDEPVAIDPLRVAGVVVHVVVPQHFGNVGHAHGRTGVTGFGFLYGVHAQCTYRIRKFFTRGHCYLLFVYRIWLCRRK